MSLVISGPVFSICRYFSLFDKPAKHQKDTKNVCRSFLQTARTSCFFAVRLVDITRGRLWGKVPTKQNWIHPFLLSHCSNQGVGNNPIHCRLIHTVRYSAMDSNQTRQTFPPALSTILVEIHSIPIQSNKTQWNDKGCGGRR